MDYLFHSLSVDYIQPRGLFRSEFLHFNRNIRTHEIRPEICAEHKVVHAVPGPEADRKSFLVGLRYGCTAAAFHDCANTADSHGFAKGDGSKESKDAYRYGEDSNTPERRTLTPTLRYVYELVTFSGSDAKSSRRVIQGTEESHVAEWDSEESYEPWEDEEREPGETEDPWENFTMQSAKICDGTQTELEELEEEAGAGPMSAAFGNTDSVGTGTGIPVSGNEVPWIVDPYGTGILTPQEERSAAEENPVTSIEDRYLARMYVEIRSFSIPLCEEMEEVVMRAILNHTADLLTTWRQRLRQDGRA